MNPILRYRSEDKRDIPDLVYAKIDQAEGTDAGWTILLDSVDAAWFDSREEWWPGLIEAAPLFILEIVLPHAGDAAMPALARALDALGRRGAESPGALDDDEDGVWLAIALAPAGLGPPVLVYDNLFAAPQRRALWQVRRVAEPQAMALRRKLSAIPDADAKDADILGVLKGIGSVAHAAAYDVGQGNANAGCDAGGHPVIYFDFGGGVMQHRGSFPSAFSAACFNCTPAIVLSHWDWDHWSAAQRFAGALAATWIAPRQPVGPTHLAFIQSIHQGGGSLHIWPPRLATSQAGQVTVQKCNGRGRNHSGLAMVLAPPAGTAGDPILFTGDANYKVVPSAGSRLHSVMVPHHGADMRPTPTPACASNADQRAVYSYGSGNRFNHPRQATLTDHDNQGWYNGGGGQNLTLARHTAQRSAAGLGHIGIYWGSPPAPGPAQCCTAGLSSCPMLIQQQ